jgi:hypothetical protein
MIIEINLSKLERGTHEGRVKVTRGGKTFYRKQRVGIKEVERSGVSIDSIMSDMDRNIAKIKSASGAIDLYVSPEKFLALCESRNIKSADVTEMRKILDFHASGGERQKMGDKEIISNLKGNTDVGEVFRLLSDLETQIIKKHFKINDKNLEMAKKQYEKDLKYYNEIMSDPDDAEIEAQRGLDFHEMKHHENLFVYRKGELGRDVESWTTDPEGAWQGKGQERLIPEHKMKIADIDKSGYMLIGGLTRKIGQSGEAEILLVRKSAI